MTVTVCCVVEPVSVPFPAMDQEYADIPGGARNWVLDAGQVKAGPLMEATGNGETVSRISSTSVQPLACTAVNLSTAVGEKT